MPAAEVRKFVTVVDEVFHEGGPVSGSPPRRGAILAVIANPFAGRFEENIQPFMDNLKPLGLEMAKRLQVALGNACHLVTRSEQIITFRKSLIG